jgi:hypothetical protein
MRHPWALCLLSLPMSLLVGLSACGGDDSGATSPDAGNPTDGITRDSRFLVVETLQSDIYSVPLRATAPTEEEVRAAHAGEGGNVSRIAKRLGLGRNPVMSCCGSMG